MKNTKSIDLVDFKENFMECEKHKNIIQKALDWSPKDKLTRQVIHQIQAHVAVELAF